MDAFAALKGFAPGSGDHGAERSCPHCLGKPFPGHHLAEHLAVAFYVLKIELLFLLCFLQFKVPDTLRASVCEPFVGSRAVGIVWDCVVEGAKPGKNSRYKNSPE